MNRVKMPAGKYYIGDLCYVMHNEWEEACELFFAGRTDLLCNEGKFKLADGREFVNFNTKYGDGEYFDGLFSYGVDSGSIGCIRVEDVREELPPGAVVMAFLEDFECYRDDNMLVFGYVEINTDPSEYEEYDEEEDEY